MKLIGDLMAKAKKKFSRKAKVAAPAPVAAPTPEAPKPEPVSIKIDAKYLRAMRHVAAKHDIRYYLNGVYFQSTKEGGKFYVATDGHRIAVIQEPWANGEVPQDIALIIPRAVAAAVRPLVKDLRYAILTQIDAWTWTLRGAGEVVQMFKAIDGKFPEWQRVMPAKCTGELGAYNWTYLHDFNLLAKDAFGVSSGFSCELQQNGSDAALVTCGSNSFVGMVMPMRVSSSNLPQWALKLQQDKAAEKKAEAERPEMRKAA